MEFGDLGFGVWGLGFGVWGLGFGVWGLGFGVWGLVPKPQTQTPNPNPKPQTPNPKPQTPNPKPQTPNPNFLISVDFNGRLNLDGEFCKRSNFKVMGIHRELTNGVWGVLNYKDFCSQRPQVRFLPSRTPNQHVPAQDFDNTKNPKMTSKRGPPCKPN